VENLDGYASGLPGWRGNFKRCQKRLDDLGIKVENSIGFTDWIVNEDTVRAKGIEQTKKEMEYTCPDWMQTYRGSA
jgi:hypothetical protein